jgi:hypothetical protein
MHEALQGRLKSEPLDAQVSHSLRLAGFSFKWKELGKRFHRQITEMYCLSTLRMITFDLDADEER